MLDNTPFGTVFFVFVNLDPQSKYEDPEPSVIYAVTAKHNIIDLPLEQEFYIVTNKEGGGYHHTPTRKRDWTSHPDTDIAVCEFQDALAVADTNAIPFNWLMARLRQTPQRSFITLGDATYTVGFYVGFHGTNSVQPVVRHGRVSLMPSRKEKIKVVMCDEDESKDYDDLPEIEAYLVEMMTWEGQSGSPVFVSFGKAEGVQVVENAASVVEAIEKQFLGMELDIRKKVFLRPQSVCIGLIQGYHPTDIRMFDPGTRTAYKLNLGMSIVVPSDKIIEVLMESEMVEERKQKMAKSSKRPLRPAPASLKQKGDQQQPLTQEGFENILRRVSQKVSESKDSDKTE